MTHRAYPNHLRSRLRLTAVAFAVTIGVVFVTPAVASASAAPDGVCTGGSVAAGTYHSLTIAGFCQLDAGNVHVWDDLTVKSGAGLLAAFGGSDLTVGRDLIVRPKGILVLGCEPEAFVCFNDPDQTVGTMATNDRVGRALIASSALMMLIHHNSIFGGVTQSGGGGGVSCSNFPLGPDGPPAYSTYEDNWIGTSATIVGVRSCWFGFIRNRVNGSVVLSNNVMADPDGNEIVTNVIKGNLTCTGNNPASQVGDSTGSANKVSGHAFGQCRHLV